MILLSHDPGFAPSGFRYSVFKVPRSVRLCSVLDTNNTQCNTLCILTEYMNFCSFLCASCNVMRGCMGMNVLTADEVIPSIPPRGIDRVLI